MFCKALARLLKTHGYEVTTYTHGGDFLKACASAYPDCLLLDLHMPDLSGFDVLERVAGQRLPVLVITAHDQPGNDTRVRALGASGYFLKPVNELALVGAIRAVLAISPIADHET